jgi:hypothetical protein
VCAKVAPTRPQPMITKCATRASYSLLLRKTLPAACGPKAKFPAAALHRGTGRFGRHDIASESD